MITNTLPLQHLRLASHTHRSNIRSNARPSAIPAGATRCPDHLRPTYSYITPTRIFGPTFS